MMKKSMIALLIIISSLISLAFGFYEKNQDIKYMDSIEKNNISTEFYISDSTVVIEEALDKLKELSERYNTSFIRTDTISENGTTYIYKSGIFTKNYFNEVNIDLSEGKFPGSELEFIATFETGDVSQCGTINDLFNDTNLIICSMDKFFSENQMDINGSYVFNADLSLRVNILNELSNFFEIPVETLTAKKYEKGYGEGTIYLISLILILIVFMIFALMSVFYPISKIKEIGVFKVLGYDTFTIWKQLNLSILMIPSIYYVLSVLIQKLIFRSIDLSYVFKLTILQAFVLLICGFISVLMSFVIRKYHISSMLKGFFNLKFSLCFSYALKFLIFIGLVIVIPQMSTQFDILYKELQVKSAYEQQKEYVTLSKYSYVGDEFQQSLSGNGSLNNKLYNLFRELERTADAQFVFSSKENTQSLIDFKSLIPTDLTFDKTANFEVMFINENYLNRLNLSLPQEVSNYFAEDKLTILYPESLIDIDEYIRYYGETVLYDEQNDGLSNPSDKVNLQTYKNNGKEIFSENIQYIDENNGFFTDPVFVCLNEEMLEMHSMFMSSSALGNPIRIYDSDSNRKAINNAIKNNDLSDNNLEFENVLTTGYRKELEISQSSSVVWIVIMILATLISILASYYIILIILTTRKKEIFVKKMMGYSLADRYKNEIINFLLIYFFGTIELFLLSRSIMSIMIYILLLVIDIFVAVFIISHKEKKHLNGMLKGEE